LVTFGRVKLTRDPVVGVVEVPVMEIVPLVATFGVQDEVVLAITKTGVVPMVLSP
jgi:hypothetical protein